MWRDGDAALTLDHLRIGTERDRPMANQKDELQSYNIGKDWNTSEVFRAAQAYLRSAELIYEQQVKLSSHWMSMPDWFVVHHLSVISTELFLKSLKVTIYHPPVRDESGPDYEIYEHAYYGHKVQFDRINKDDIEDLRNHLSSHQFQILKSMENRDAARAEISRGRYPYQTLKDSGFPAGDAGRNLAEEWLNLARSLSDFCS